MAPLLRSLLAASVGETIGESHQDMILGFSFLFIAIFSAVRVVRSYQTSGGRKVIATFNLLIFIASFSRALWFLLPNELIEPSYAPTPLIAFSSPGWFGVLLSELLLSIGSLSLYGIFILIACYWVHMLAKLESDTALEEVQNDSLWMRLTEGFKINRRGTIQMFLIIMTVVLVFQLFGMLLFLFQILNSEGMILYDSILMSIISLAIVVKITLLSNQIRFVLANLEAINARNSQPQIRRIFAIIVVAHLFFVTRVVLEVGLSVCLVILMKDQHSFSVVISDRYWSLYVLLKHSSEVVVLGLELAISTAIRAYDTTGVNQRHNQPNTTTSGVQQSGVQGGGSASVGRGRGGGGGSKMGFSGSTGGPPTDRTSIAYHKLPNYNTTNNATNTSALEMSNTASNKAAKAPLINKPNTLNYLGGNSKGPELR